MDNLSMTQAAADEVRALLNSSGCQQPIATLIDESQSFPMASEVAESLLNAGGEERFAFAMRDYRERQAALNFRLYVGIYERHKFEPQDVTSIEGLAFAIPHQIIGHRSKYTLDYVDGQFLLKSDDRVFVRLMDVGNEDAV